MYQQQLNAINTMNNHEKPGDLYKVNKVQEELLMKSNLDYENRLRGHMYQFDEHELTAV